MVFPPCVFFCWLGFGIIAEEGLCLPCDRVGQEGFVFSSLLIIILSLCGGCGVSAQGWHEFRERSLEDIDLLTSTLIMYVGT